MTYVAYVARKRKINCFWSHLGEKESNDLAVPITGSDMQRRFVVLYVINASNERHVSV